MKTLSLLSCCCNAQHFADWSPVINAIPSICWGIILIVALSLILKYVAMPLIVNGHEKRMKEKSYENEKIWFFLNHELSMEECQKELKEAREKLNEYDNKEKDLEDGLEKLKSEKEEFEKTVLEEKIKAYKDIVKYLGRCIH